LFLRRVRPLSRLRQTKNFFERRYAEPLAYVASKPTGKILGGGKILPINSKLVLKTELLFKNLI
jgi:hypothetical protein